MLPGWLVTEELVSGSGKNPRKVATRISRSVSRFKEKIRKKHVRSEKANFAVDQFRRRAEYRG